MTTTKSEGASTPAAPRVRMLSLAFLLSAISALGPLSIDMYLPAVPTMGEQLNGSPASIQMTIAIFMIGMGAGQLLFGPISDRLGRRWPAMFGLALYIGSSAFCAMAHDVEGLIIFRFMQALGVCGGQVVARAILADLFEPRDLARFSSLLSMIILVAPIVAPLIGGFIFTAFGWRPLFWALAVYGVVVLVSTVAFLPETLSGAAKAKARTESALGSYLSVARNWPLMKMALAAGFGQAAFASYLGSAPHLLIDYYKIPPAHFGFYFASNAVGLWIGASINRRMLRRMQPQQLLPRTCVLYLIFTVLLLIGAHWPATGRWGVLVPLFFVVGTFPTVMGNANAVAQGFDRSRAGAVAAVLGAVGAFMQFAGISAVAALSDGTPHAMSYVMVVGAAICASLFLFGPKRKTSS